MAPTLSFIESYRSMVGTLTEALLKLWVLRRGRSPTEASPILPSALCIVNDISFRQAESRDVTEPH